MHTPFPIPSYVHDRSVKLMSHALCTYIDQRAMAEPRARHYKILLDLGITTSMTPGLLLELLEAWVKLGTFTTTIEHMKHVYSFLGFHVGKHAGSSRNTKKNIITFMQTQRSIFVPNKHGKCHEREAVEGEFKYLWEVCWKDQSGAAGYFPRGLAEVHALYGKEFRHFFCIMCKMCEHPSIEQHIKLVEKATTTKIRTLTFSTQLKCCKVVLTSWRERKESELQDLKEKLNQFYTVKFLPTAEDGTWKALSDQLLLCDDAKLAACFGKDLHPHLVHETLAQAVPGLLEVQCGLQKLSDVCEQQNNVTTRVPDEVADQQLKSQLQTCLCAAQRWLFTHRHKTYRSLTTIAEENGSSNESSVPAVAKQLRGLEWVSATAISRQISVPRHDLATTEKVDWIVDVSTSGATVTVVVHAGQISMEASELKPLVLELVKTLFFPESSSVQTTKWARKLSEFLIAQMEDPDLLRELDELPDEEDCIWLRDNRREPSPAGAVEEDHVDVVDGSNDWEFGILPRMSASKRVSNTKAIPLIARGALDAVPLVPESGMREDPMREDPNSVSMTQTLLHPFGGSASVPPSAPEQFVVSNDASGTKANESVQTAQAVGTVQPVASSLSEKAPTAPVERLVHTATAMTEEFPSAVVTPQLQPQPSAEPQPQQQPQPNAQPQPYTGDPTSGATQDQLDPMVRKLLQAHAKGDASQVEKVLQGLMAELKSGWTFSKASVTHWVGILDGIVNRHLYSLRLQHQCRQYLQIGQQQQQQQVVEARSSPRAPGQRTTPGVYQSNFGWGRTTWINATESDFSQKWEDFPKDLAVQPEIHSSDVRDRQLRAARRGEQIVTKLLQRLHPDDEVVWMNEQRERGYPYDIRVRRGGGRVVYVEVKIISVDKQWCHISLPEHKFAMKEAPKGNYELFCIQGTRYIRERNFDKLLAQRGYILQISS